jgi:tRNA(Ile)-lysidine synthase TilS/MesJ
MMATDIMIEGGDAMPGKIFYRERRQVEKGEEKARFTVAAVAGLDLDFIAEHFRRHELEQIADEIGAELILLEDVKKTRQYKEKP